MSQKVKADITLGQNLRDIRKARKLTQEQVVTKMQLLGFDISRSIYSQIECGTYNIKITELIALKQIYDVEIDDFFKSISLPKKNE